MRAASTSATRGWPRSTGCSVAPPPLPRLNSMSRAVVLSAVRTPIGRYGGALSGVRPDDLAALVIREAVARAGVPAEQIEDVVFGAANQAGEDNRNVARMALLLAGLPVSVGGVTVNRLCASGLQAIMDAARATALGEGEVYIAGGVENMSRAPFVMAKSEEPYSRKADIHDTTIGWRFTNPRLARMYYPFSMGETAENVAAKWKISRSEQDEFGLDSQNNYARAHQDGKFKEELVSVPVEKGKEKIDFIKDEYPRETSMEKLAALRPAFKENGTVTAGNSSGINDGAAACLIAH